MKLINGIRNGLVYKMGVDIRHYVIVGIKISDPDFVKAMGLTEDDSVYDYLEDNEDIVNSWDAKKGDFTYIAMEEGDSILGIVVAKAIEEEGEGLPVVDCMKAYEKYRFEVAEKLRKVGITIGKISTWVFTEYA